MTETDLEQSRAKRRILLLLAALFVAQLAMAVFTAFQGERTSSLGFALGAIILLAAAWFYNAKLRPTAEIAGTRLPPRKRIAGYGLLLALTIPLYWLASAQDGRVFGFIQALVLGGLAAAGILFELFRVRGRRIPR
jgi:hypothetical protein